MLKLSELALRPDLRFGPMLVSPSRRLVEGPSGKAHLEPLIMQAFLLLLDAQGKVVTRTELFEQCWGGGIAGDDSLNRAIAKLRRTVEQVAPGVIEVETIPRTGYRLTAGGAPLQVDPSAEPGEARQESQISRRALVASGVVAAGLASAGAWVALRPTNDPRVARLTGEADQILRYELSDRRLSAIPLLEQALSIDPGDSTALGLLAYARAVAITPTRPDGPNRVAAAERAIKAALAANGDDPHARLAKMLMERTGYDWAASEDELRAILSIAPANPLAMGWLVALYQAAGLNKLSWDLNERHLAVDTVSPGPRYRKALKHWIYGRTGDAYQLADRLVQIWPRHPWVWNARFLILAFTGRPHAALDMIDDADSRPETITPARMAQWRPTLAALERPTPSLLAAARDANLAAARQSPGQAAYAIMALSGIDQIDAAYEVAEGFLLAKGKIVTRRPSDRSNMLVNNSGWRDTQWLSTPPLAGFRADPRFGALCDGIGLTEYWRSRRVRPDYPSDQI